MTTPITLTMPASSGFGVNYYHESMGYLGRTNAQIQQDLTTIAAVTKNIKVYFNPLPQNAGGVSRSSALSLLSYIISQAKTDGFHVVWCENIDQGRVLTDSTTNLTNSGSYEWKWSDYATQVIADAATAKSYGADEFLVGNEIQGSTHYYATDPGTGSPTTIYNGTTFPSYVSTLVNNCRANFSGSIGYQEVNTVSGNWSGSGLANSGLGNLDYLYFNLYEKWYNFQNKASGFATTFGSNVSKIRIGETSSIDVLGNIGNYAAYGENDWSRELMRRYDFLRQQSLIFYAFTYGDPSANSNGFGLRDNTSDNQTFHDIWNYFTGAKTSISFNEYINDTFPPDDFTGGTGGPGGQLNISSSATFASYTVPGSATNYVFRGRVQWQSSTGTLRLVGRYTDANNYYCIHIDITNNQVYCVRRQGGTETALGTTVPWPPQGSYSGSFSGSTYTWFDFEMRFNGTGASTTVQAFLDTYQMVDTTDTTSTLSGSTVGVLYQSANASVGAVIVSDLEQYNTGSGGSGGTTFSLSPTSITCNGQEGIWTPGQSVTITNNSATTGTWDITSFASSFGGWAYPNSGTLAANQSQTFLFGAILTTTPPGTYTGTAYFTGGATLTVNSTVTAPPPVPPWLPTNYNLYAVDTFVRAFQTSWGTASDDSDSWAIPVDGGPSTWYIDNNVGVLNNANQNVMLLGSGTVGDAEILMACYVSGSATAFAPLLRASSAGTTGYVALLNNNQLALYRWNGTISFTTALATIAFPVQTDTWYWLRFQVTGSVSPLLEARTWRDGAAESNFWMLTYSDSSASALLSAGQYGIYVQPLSAQQDVVAYFECNKLIHPYPKAYAVDNFVRSNQTGWGVASDGQPWALASGTGTPTIASDEGVLVSSGTDTDMQIGAFSLSNVEIRCRMSINLAGDICGVEARFSTTGGVNCYKLLYYTGGIHLNKAVAGANTQIVTATLTMTVNTFYWFRLRLNGTTLLGKVWQDGTAEPSNWMVSTTDTSLTSGGFALIANTASGSTGVRFDSLYVFDYTMSESVPVADSILTSGGYSATESNTIVDSSLMSGGYSPMESNTAADSYQVSNGYSTTESLLVSDSFQTNAVAMWAEALVALDAFNASAPAILNYMTFVDALVITSALSVGAGYQPVESASLSLASQQSISNNLAWQEVLSVADILTTQASYVASEAGTITDTATMGQFFNSVESLVASDAVTWQSLDIWIESLAALDDFSAPPPAILNYMTFVDALVITSALSVGAGYSIVEQGLVTDALATIQQYDPVESVAYQGMGRTLYVTRVFGGTLIINESETAGVSDLFSMGQSYQPIENMVGTDALSSQQIYAPVEALAVADAGGATGVYSVTDVLMASDGVSWQAVEVWIELLSASDTGSSLASTIFNYMTSVEQLTISDIFTVGQEYQTVEMLSIADTALFALAMQPVEPLVASSSLETRVISSWQEDGNSADSFTMQSVYQPPAESLSVTDAWFTSLAPIFQEAMSVSDTIALSSTTSWTEMLAASDIGGMQAAYQQIEQLFVSDSQQFQSIQDSQESLQALAAFTATQTAVWQEDAAIVSGTLSAQAVTWLDQLNASDLATTLTQIAGIPVIRSVLVTRTGRTTLKARS